MPCTCNIEKTRRKTHLASCELRRHPLDTNLPSNPILKYLDRQTEDSVNIELHRHIIERMRLEPLAASGDADARIRLEVLNGVIELASRLSQDRTSNPCYEDICSLIVELT